MNSKTWKGKRLGAILAIVLTALLLVTACAPAPAEPVEEKVVEIGFAGILTGAAAPQVIRSLEALLDYVRYFNEEEIMPGVTIEVVWRDSAATVERWASAYEAFKARGIPVMMSTDTVGVIPFQERLERDKMPLYCGNPYQEIVYPPLWYYFHSPTWAEQFAVLADYIMENWQEERPPKLAFIAIDHPLGRQVEIVGKRYAEGLGFEVLPMEFVPHIPFDTTPQLLRIREGGADFVYFSAHAIPVGPVLRDAERLGLLDKIQFCGISQSLAREMLNMVGAAAEGYLAPETVPTFAETEVPGIKLMLDIQMKYHGELTPEPDYLFGGWVPGTITCEAIRRAVENVGYENLNGPAIKQAFDSIKDFDVYGLVTITYNPPDDQRGSNKVAIYEVRGGELIRVTDWQEAPMLAPEE